MDYIFPDYIFLNYILPGFVIILIGVLAILIIGQRPKGK